MIDLDSDTWRDVSAFVTAEQNRTLKALTSPKLDLPMTQLLRGQLLAFRAVLELPQTQQQSSVSTTLPQEIYL